MIMNHMICPKCGHDFYTDCNYGTCAACSTHFYASESRTCNANHSFNPVFNITNSAGRPEDIAKTIEIEMRKLNVRTP